MKYVKRILYFVYYIRQTDSKKIRKFRKYVKQTTGRSKAGIFFDELLSVFRYNISFLDYYYFRFFQLSDTERRKWAGTGYMYEYQLAMNPKTSRELLENKLQFLNSYEAYFNRKFSSLESVKSDADLLNSLLGNSTGRLVLKNSRGQVGAQVEVIQCSEFSGKDLIAYMMKKNYDLVEEYVIQHQDLMALSPSGLNTLRIFTQLQDGTVNFLGARLRISVNSMVDNMGAGNLAAPVDIETGKVSGAAVYSDITMTETTIHPVTGKEIEGFQVPFWSQILEFSKKVALHAPENKSVGWDVAVTEKGPELIEGNHNWCKLLWQLPVKTGLKSELEQYI